MTINQFFNQYPQLLLILVAVFSMCIGSFINVIIYRLPLMMHRTWRTECLAFLKQVPEIQETQETFNLFLPRSRCPHCKTLIVSWQNIPVISYLCLGGRCAHCKKKISVRYPLVELLTAVLSVIVVWRFGFSWQSLAAVVLTWSLIAASFIDIDHQIIPDELILPLLWIGLLMSIQGLFVNATHAIIGAAAGYMSLWLLAWLFLQITGREGMGHGDFKLLALFGAWLGWAILPLIVLLSSVAAAVIGLTIHIVKRHEESQPMPYGPYIAIAGWIALIWGPQLMQQYFLWARS